MKLIKCFLFLISVITFTSCKNDDDNSGVVSQHFVHKYGFDMTEKEWQTREKEGQSVTVLDDGVTITNTYDNGILHGKTTYTFPYSSTIEKTLEYDEGILIKEKHHDEKGIPYKEESSELENKKIVTLWDDSGVPISSEEYEGNILSNASYYKPNNEIEASIQNGSGIRIKRDRSGELQYKDVIESGNIKNRTTYHPNGQIKSTIFYKNYELHGPQTTYTPTGTVLMKANWTNGVLNGIKTTYRNGKKVSEVPYTMGLRHGVERRWEDDGRLKVEIHWEKDKKHGSHRVYKEDETEIKWFYKGKAVSIKRFEDFSYREKLVADKEKFLEMVEKLDSIEALKEN